MIFIGSWPVPWIHSLFHPCFAIFYDPSQRNGFYPKLTAKDLDETVRDYLKTPKSMLSKFKKFWMIP